MTPEKLIKDKIRAYLKTLHPKPYVYMPVPTGFGASTLDFLVCWKGQFYGIEAKRETGGRVTARQECILRDIAEAGGGVCVENHVDCRNVKEMLR